MKNNRPSTSWLSRLSHSFSGEPHNKLELIELLRDACKRDLLDGDALEMIEGVLSVSSMKVKDVMIPRTQVVYVEKSQRSTEFLPTIIESAHSRFPVMGEDKDDVVGILLAKDLLKWMVEHNSTEMSLNNKILRPAVFVPESKCLDALLKEFRQSHNHLAIVVNEYGGVSGIVTIEDVLEEIVGEIEDEFDTDDEAFIQPQVDGCFQVSAMTPLNDFNEHFDTHLPCERVDTLGGWVMQALERIPKVGDSLNAESLTIEVTHANRRCVTQLKVTPHEA